VLPIEEAAISVRRRISGSSSGNPAPNKITVGLPEVESNSGK